jgi:hypothetical protein
MPERVMIPVYSENESRRKPAKITLLREKCQELYDAGLARWNSPKQTVLIMKKLDAEMYRPAPSLNPNEKVMDDFVIGKPYAVAIIESWAFAA